MRYVCVIFHVVICARLLHIKVMNGAVRDRIDFLIRNSHYLKEPRYHDSWRKDCSVVEARSILEKAKFLKNTDEMDATRWSVRCALEGLLVRSEFLETFKPNNRKSVFDLMVHDYVINTFLDCAIALRAGSADWIRSLTLVKSTLTNVYDPMVAKELSRHATARKIVASKVERLKSDPVHAYLNRRLRSAISDYSWAEPVVRNVHRSRVRESEHRMDRRFGMK